MNKILKLTIALALAVFLAGLLLPGTAEARYIIKRAAVNLEHEPIGRCFIYSDFSFILELPDGAIKTELTKAMQELIARGSAALRYEDKEGDALVMREGTFTRDEPNFANALLYSAAEQANSTTKDGYISFTPLADQIAPAPAEEPNKVYKLTSLTRQADLDYKMIKNLDSIPTPFPKGSNYQIGDLKTVKGKYLIYKFIAAYEGETAEGAGYFHDLLVIKTSQTGEILDAYNYTLEWQDTPSLALYRATSTGQKLVSGFDISGLDLVNIGSHAPFTGRGYVSF